MNPILAPTAGCGACAALEGGLFFEHEVVHGPDCPHGESTNEAIALLKTFYEEEHPGQQKEDLAKLSLGTQE